MAVFAKQAAPAEARTIDLRDATGGVVGSVELPGELFGAKVNKPLMHQVVVAQLAAARQGTHATKTRGDVRGGGRKPYRQKGTGRARQGSIRAPQFTGGGVVHGPQPRDYSQRTPKKMKAAALRSALTDRATHGRVHVITGFVGGDGPSTKEAKGALANLTERRRVLVVVNRVEDQLTWLSLRNLADVHLLDPGQLNTYDVLLADDLVFTRSAFETFVRDRTGAEAVVTESGSTESGSTGATRAAVSSDSDEAEGSEA